jgi:hypothetical protein
MENLFKELVANSGTTKFNKPYASLMLSFIGIKNYLTEEERRQLKEGIIKALETKNEVSNPKPHFYCGKYEIGSITGNITYVHYKRISNAKNYKMAIDVIEKELDLKRGETATIVLHDLGEYEEPI